VLRRTVELDHTSKRNVLKRMGLRRERSKSSTFFQIRKLNGKESEMPNEKRGGEVRQKGLARN